jgi:hypothetical protein
VSFVGPELETVRAAAAATITRAPINATATALRLCTARFLIPSLQGSTMWLTF